MDQNSQGKRILIVEDDKEYRTILAKALQESGFSIKLAEDGQVAIDILRNNDFDLILLDLVMPNMDGQTFLYHLKNTLGKDTPVILLTNLTEAPYPSNVRDFVIKASTSLEDLIKRVNQNLPYKEDLTAPV